MNRKAGILTSMILTMGLMTGATASAFDDVAGLTGEAKIIELKRQGIVNGVEEGRFAPHSTMTSAQGVSLLVKAFDLSLAAFTFIKAPEASDFFDRVPEDAWYTQDFITASLNGVPIPRDIDPNAALTREQFAEWLMAAVDKQGPFAFPMIYMIVEDEKDVTPERMGAIQLMLIAKIASVDAEGKFNPKQAITRAEATVWVHDALQFVREHEKAREEANTPPVELSTEAVTKEVTKVKLSAQLPNPGYGIAIESIEFTSDNRALIGYRVYQPDPDKMYPQVISDVELTTYIDSKYTPEAVKLPANEVASSVPGISAGGKE